MLFSAVTWPPSLKQSPAGPALLLALLLRLLRRWLWYVIGHFIGMR